ncbi:hypothetical protein M409DRAFT_68744 [Zasmidium cellare ATCC 36951]|uniref:Enoyl reductase (ER) domain-containing protein n=1 Tax=Zasmidium cellare ATCC 36951 TaxID=1080233 RepID=A0A6A6CA75_ZASCE|nr:uncharacterized protein M409DRAFT_68744 [Zasmidium cellare ATCC 36951]KAF2163130.1 hypothetical protein M409DRAFT_68744 [Zasmidium cellare ATCC 36951]
MSTHRAAFLDGVAQSLRAGAIPTPTPSPGEILIRNKALAINPIDWKQQTYGFYIDAFPVILGTDSSGVVAAVGEGVTKFKVGQRVIGHGITLATKNNANGAFQEYTLCPEGAVAPIPDSLTFEEASVLPLAVSTAAAGLFEKNHLGLEYPGAPGDRSGKTVLVWGGSSSVGSLAIQLAKAAGYRVLATSSEKNFDFVASLGATPFDYRRGDVFKGIGEELRKGEFVGIYDAIAEGDTGKICSEIAKELGGGVIASALDPPPELPSGVTAQMIFAPTVFLMEPAVAKAIWQDFLPQALADGRIKPTPRVDVVGAGLEAIQGAMEKHKQGVSASKIVVSL